MKIIHISFCYYPDPIGGTEVYVESLTHHMQQLGAIATIVAPGGKTCSYEHNGLSVRRFAVSNGVNDIRELYGEGNVTASQEFAEILDEEQPDIVHLHAFTRGASLRLVREAKQRGIKVVFTYHTPTVSCQRGTLLRWGKEVCDGRLDVRACAGCTLHALGLSKGSGLILGRIPILIGRLAGSAGLSGGAWTALRMTELVALRQSTLRALMQEVDRVVALCQWTKDLLLRNGVPAEKITISRHGLPYVAEAIGQKVDSLPATAFPLRIAFLGRLDQTKGPDILVRALRSLPEASVELHLYGIVQSAASTEYFEQLKKLAEDDPRISFLPAVPSDRIVSLLRSYHLLAVPSRLLETGPLVVLEAFAAGTPVIGSDLGGIAELVEHEVNGMLVETDSVKAWSQVMRRCSEDRTLLERLRRGIRPPRGMDAVAMEMLTLYGQALQVNVVHQAPDYPKEKAHARS